MEVILSCFTHKRFVNRGFLIGPYCPIYGVGVLLIINFLKNYMDNFIVLFILAMVICMILEYMTSYLMEKIFNARWWDYSDKKFNINGRICLETAIPFGILGLTIMYIINPYIESVLDMIPDMILIVIGEVIFTLFVIDFIVSFVVILKFRNMDLSKCKDDTEDISKRVMDYLKEKSSLTRRLVLAFPNLKLRIEKFRKKLEDSIDKLVD